MNKEAGLGVTCSYPPIENIHLKRIVEYSKEKMLEPPNAKNLQEIMIFYVLFYMCRRGRENLRAMKKSTFVIATDPEDNRRYIYQAVDEINKNHSEYDTSLANDGRIYAIPGTVSLYFTIALQHKSTKI